MKIDILNVGGNVFTWRVGLREYWQYIIEREKYWYCKKREKQPIVSQLSLCTKDNFVKELIIQQQIFTTSDYQPKNNIFGNN